MIEGDSEGYGKREWEKRGRGAEREGGKWKEEKKDDGRRRERESGKRVEGRKREREGGEKWEQEEVRIVALIELDHF